MIITEWEEKVGRQSIFAQDPSFLGSVHGTHSRRFRNNPQIAYYVVCKSLCVTFEVFEIDITEFYPVFDYSGRLVNLNMHLGHIN